MRKICFYIILILAFTILISSFYVVQAVTNSDRAVCVVKDEDSFYKTLSSANEKNMPLLLTEGKEYEKEKIKTFEELYSGKEISSEVIEDKETLVVVSKEDKRIVALAAHISAELKANFIYEEELSNKANIDKYKKIIAFGVTKACGNITESYKSYEETRTFYDSVIKDKDLIVYVEDLDYCPMASCLATFRKGKIYFSLEEIEDKNSYVAYLVKPENLSADKYVKFYNFFNKDKSIRYNKGIGVVTGNSLLDINLMLLRSFYYQDMKNNLGNTFLRIKIMSKGEKREFTEKENKYITSYGGNTNLDESIKSISESKYSFIFAHGSNAGFQFEKGSLDSSNFPVTNASLIVAEACQTGMIWEKNSIALKAIENGAVAYIGSIKVGGSAVIENSYIYSHKDMPISNLLLINNEKISSFDAMPRGILIGDPMWYMNEKVISYNDGKYSFELPFNPVDNYTLPIDLKDNTKDVKAVKIIGEKDTKYFNVEKLKGENNKIYITDIKSNTSKGTIELMDKKPISLILNDSMNYIMSSTFTILLDLFASLQAIGIPAVIILFIFNANIKEKHKVNKKENLIIYTSSLIFAVLLVKAGQLLMLIPIKPINLIVYLLLFSTLLQVKGFVKRQIIYLSSIALPLLVTCIFIGQGKVMLSMGIVGFITFGIIINLLVVFVDKILLKS